MHEARPYQVRGHDAVDDAWTRVKRVVFVMPTGGGKTFCAAWHVRDAVAQGQRVLWLAGRRELLAQAAKALFANGVRDVGIVSPQHHVDPWAKVQVASLDTLVSRGHRPQADLVVYDECFPGHTRIMLKNGCSLPIRDVVVGATVVNGGRVLRNFSRRVTSLLRVIHEHGALVCTPNHPIYVEEHGYLQAQDLVHGHVLRVRNAIYMGRADELPAASHLLPEVPRGAILDDHGCYQSCARQRAHEAQQPHASGSNARKGEEPSQGVGSQTEAARRQRPWSDPLRGALGGGMPGVGDPCEGADRHAVAVAIGVQARPCAHAYQNRDRGRRILACRSVTPGPGPEEGSVPCRSRVVRVEVLESGSDGTFGGLCPDHTVYNLETERGAYIADNVLVHNCHHAPAKTYRALLEPYADKRVLGLTATPARGDGKALGDFFEELVVGATYSELLALNREHPDQGIVPCRVFQPPRYLGSDLAQDPLDGWRALQKLGIDGSCFAFARDVEDAKQRVREFRMAGIRSDYLSGKCHNNRRTEVLDAFRAGRITVLWNVGIFTEGTDVPDVRVILLSRGCGNPGTYLQIAGRGLRPAPGKRFAVLLDLVGVSRSEIYGPPTLDRTYSLDGRPITVEGTPLKNCPKCGSTIPAALPICDSTMPDGSPCRYVFEGRPRKAIKVWNLELQEAVDAAGGDINAVPRESKLDEAKRLLAMGRVNKYSVAWAIQRWTHTFTGERFPMHLVTAEDKRLEFARLQELERTKKWKPGAAKIKFKVAFGHWPERTP